jgi:PAS domain S-box-containing protein
VNDVLRSTEDNGAFLSGSGEMATRIRAHDWSATSLGPIGTWPPALRVALNLILASPESMYLVWGEELHFFSNDAYRPFLGPRLPQAVGTTLPALWPDAFEAVRPFLEKAFSGGASRFEDMPLAMARSGVPEETWWTFSCSPVRDEEGRISGVLCFTNETSAGMRAARVLRASEQVLRASEHDLRASEHDLRASEAALRDLNTTLEAHVAERTAERDRAWRLSQDLLVVAAPDGTLEAVNAAWTRLLGWQEAELTGRTFVDITHPEDIEAALAVLTAVIDTPLVAPYEYRLRHRDGTYRSVAWTGSFEDGRIYASGRDVTAENEREATYRDFEDFARLALTSVGGVGVWTYDVGSDRFICDAAISDLYSLDPQRGAAGVSSAEFLSNVHPDDRPRLGATMSGGLKQSGDLELEYRLLHPGGIVRWVLSRGHTYFDEAGKPSRRVGVGIETTKQRQLEDALRQSQKLEAVGQLTGGVAHDFNNLLTVIKSSTDLLKRPDLPEERRTRYVGAISDTVDRAAKLTGQLLAFARRQALKPEVFDVGQSVRMLGDMVGTLTGARIQIVTHLPDDACFINADPSQFDTAVVNIAVNARDAMDGEGQITITVRPVDAMPAVRTHAAVAGPYVAVSIGDTGSGIPSDQIERIFEPFFTTKGVGQGTGLGLSQVFGFAKQSDGEVLVTSVVGQGSTFTLYLPRVPAPTGIATVEERELTEEGRGTCVLVVEDNRDVGAFVTQTLGELGYRTHWVESGQAALDALASAPGAHEIVFSDVVMPGMNGVELGRQVQRLYPDLPFVLTSGYSHVLAEEGGHGFELLQKPYSVEALSRVLRKAASFRKRTPPRAG